MIQFKHLATIPQGCILQFLHLSLLNILTLYQNMYQVRYHPDLQVLLQAVYHLRTIVHFHHLYQDQVHWGIHIKHQATSPQSCLLRFLHLNLLKILELYHTISQVRYHIELQFLCQTLSHQIIKARYQHLYQDQDHLDLQVNHLSTIPKVFHPKSLKLILIVVLALYHHIYQMWIHPDIQVKNRLGIYKNKVGQHLNKLKPCKILFRQ